MSKNKRKETEGEKKSTAEYYKLHTEAVEDLVNADESNLPEVSPEELRKYQSGSRFRIPVWLRILFIRFWFPAMVCYFFIWGLSTYVSNLLDMLVITGIALGVVTEMLTNNVLRFFAKTEGEHDRWMMFPQKSYWTFPLNILYAWVVLFLVFTLYNVVNLLYNRLTGTAGTVFLGVEPVLFGLFYLGFDTLLIEAKHLCGNIWRDALKKTNRG
ncbi:MAG: hypothetical protein LUC99_03295 [Clostridiales bacterium]|nr:hypothetical protein [Clostridiales bacterium]